MQQKENEERTVAYYRDLLDRGEELKGDLRDNPRPVDGKTIDWIKSLPKEELEKEINRIAEMENKSYSRKMFAEGYAFTWADLVKAMAECGYVSKEMFVAVDNNKNADDNSNKHIIYVSPSERGETENARYTFDKELLNQIDLMLKNTEYIFSKQLKSKIINELLRIGFERVRPRGKRDNIVVKFRECEVSKNRRE